MTENRPTLPKLTQQERDALQAIAAGMSDGDTRHNLQISLNEWGDLLLKIFRKLGVSSREEAIRVGHTYRLVH